MALYIAVARGAEERPLGEFSAVEILRGELRDPHEKSLLARHVHHRWLVGESPESYERLEVIGPAFVIELDGTETRLGPYGHFSIVNGVMYADRRVFGFVDVQQMNFYLADLGVHCKGIRLEFNRRG